MNIAVLSDIHSNKFALLATLNFLKEKKIDKYIFLGDFFGYYPWADETFELINDIFLNSIHILGNHDDLIISPKKMVEKPEYWDVIVQNKNNLPKKALHWLISLESEDFFEIDGLNIRICHGTPDDTLMGRYYPDDMKEYAWFPKNNEVLLMGHTHYPLLKKTKNGGLIVNPGSVGQPRDGILESSLCILDTSNLDVTFFRIPYLIDVALTELIKLNWYPRAILALKKSENKIDNKLNTDI